MCAALAIVAECFRGLCRGGNVASPGLTARLHTSAPAHVVILGYSTVCGLSLGLRTPTRCGVTTFCNFGRGQRPAVLDLTADSARRRHLDGRAAM
jgi:hypothetical protein